MTDSSRAMRSGETSGANARSTSAAVALWPSKSKSSCEYGNRDVSNAAAEARLTNFFTRRFRCRSIGFSGSADGSAVRLGATLCAVRLMEGPRCALERTVPTGTGSTMVPIPGPSGASREGASSEDEAANLTLNRSAPRPRRRGTAKTAVTRLLTSASIAVLGASVNWAAGAQGAQLGKRGTSRLALAKNGEKRRLISRVTKK